MFDEDVRVPVAILRAAEEGEVTCVRAAGGGSDQGAVLVSGRRAGGKCLSPIY